MNEDYVDQLCKIEGAGGLPEFQERACVALSALGFPMFTYYVYRLGHIAEAPFFLSIFSRDWIRQYHANGYQDVDVIIKKALQTFSSFIWPEKPLYNSLKL